MTLRGDSPKRPAGSRRERRNGCDIVIARVGSLTEPIGQDRVQHRIAVIPGDGIGPEVTRAAIAVLDAAAARAGVHFTYDEFDWSCARFQREGAMMPPDGIEQLRPYDAILLGAVGAPGVPDHVSLWGLVIPIRRAFDQYVNLRPVRSFPGVPGPLTSSEPIDLVIVRENVEGEYSELGGRAYAGTPWEQATQQSLFTRHGVERIVRYALRLAAERTGRLTSATKSNGIMHTMTFWDEIVSRSAADWPGVTVTREHIDALCAKLVLRPGEFDVVVGSNLFGDILSDLAAALAGSIGIAPSGNINPDGGGPSMFEPIHGSAPDIAGQGIANPLGAIWSGAMMLEHLGAPKAAAEVRTAMEHVLGLGPGFRTPDLGGTADTQAVAAAVVKAVADTATIASRGASRD
jgi:tartrate dehydrogenase/decarboxylase / D-malate dehydrogenase